MKSIKTMLLLILFISCADKKADKFTAEFESVLGKENIETLDFLVDDFENHFLKNQYPNLDTEIAYKQYLLDLKAGKEENWKSVSQKASDKFNSSDLRLEKYKFPDSVWILKNSTYDKMESDSIIILESPLPYVKKRFKHTYPDGTFEYTGESIYGFLTSEDDFDSVIKQELRLPRFNFRGKYFQALMAIKDKSKLHQRLFEIKGSEGDTFADVIAGIFLHHEIDLNDALNRRLIVLEIMY